MADTDLDKHIEAVVDRKIQNRLDTIQRDLLRKEFLTREEFLVAIERINRSLEVLISEIGKGFEAQGKRFEQADKRFEQANKLFEALITEVRSGFEKAYRNDLRIQAAMDNFGDRSGQSLQEAVLELMDSLIVQAGVDYKLVERKTLVDMNGTVFYPSFSTDVDIVAKDGEVHLFEVKYKADQRDFAHFLKVAQLYEVVEGVHPTKLFMITLEVSQKTLRATASLSIEVIAGSVVL